MVPVDALYRVRHGQRLRAGQPTQQDLRPTILLRERLGKMLSGEAGEAGFHLPGRSTNDRQVPQVDPGFPAHNVDQLGKPWRCGCFGIGGGVGDELPIAGILCVAPLEFEVGQDGLVGGGGVTADPIFTALRRPRHKIRASNLGDGIGAAL